MGDAELHYTFICPNCSGNFSIQLDRIPPVQARFRCPHCKEPMDFPSREEARMYIRLQGDRAGGTASGEFPEGVPPKATGGPASGELPEGVPPRRKESEKEKDRETPTPDSGAAVSTDGVRFRVDKPGFQTDVFDRRGIRNLIRTGELVDTDGLRVDELPAVPAGDLPFLRSLFNMAREQKVRPPVSCRTHTHKMAFFQCHDTGRPLCEDCSPEKKFGGQTIRVCQHCGGTAVDFAPA